MTRVWVSETADRPPKQRTTTETRGLPTVGREASGMRGMLQMLACGN